jgi:hypothetical protein
MDAVGYLLVDSVGERDKRCGLVGSGIPLPWLHLVPGPSVAKSDFSYDFREAI